MFLELKDVYYTYMPGTPFAVQALKSVSLVAEKGEFVGIMGSTGSGKSTLIQHLNGLLFPDSGKVYVEGTPLEPGASSLKEIRARIGLVFQYPENQLFAETVYQDVSFGPSQQGVAPSLLEERARESLEKVGLDYYSLRDRSPFELSRGQMRRVALAGVLAMRPRALLLDEPTSGLDPRGSRELLTFITELHRKEGVTVIMVTHRSAEIAELADRIVVLHAGEIKLNGTPAEVFGSAREIAGYGLELPPAVELARLLRKRGGPAPQDPLKEEEICREVAYLYRKGDTP